MNVFCKVLNVVVICVGGAMARYVSNDSHGKLYPVWETTRFHSILWDSTEVGLVDNHTVTHVLCRSEWKTHDVNDFPFPQCTFRTTTMSWLSNIGLTDVTSWLPSRNTARHVLIGVLLGFSFSATSSSLALYYYRRRRKDPLVPNFTPRPIELRSDEIVRGISGLIGIQSLVTLLKSFYQLDSYRKYTFG